jgi:signal transduction histidine kinase
MLEQDKLKTEFFANLSHELRTPTTIILSTLQLLNQYINNGKLEPSNFDKYIRVMRQNCYRLIRLTNNLIDATKIDAGFYEFHPQNCDIVSLVKNIAMSVADYVGSKGLSLEFQTDIEQKVIACDPDMIERIILNLLSNAVKFTKNNGKISVMLSDKDGSTAISVKDNGMGIRKDKQNNIFKRFNQADKSLTRKREGSGIGLSLVKSLVEMHNGSIFLKSTYGHGSEFIIILPSVLTESLSPDTMKKQLKSSKDFIDRINIEFSDIYI